MRVFLAEYSGVFTTSCCSLTCAPAASGIGGGEVVRPARPTTPGRAKLLQWSRGVARFPAPGHPGIALMGRTPGSPAACPS